MNDGVDTITESIFMLQDLNQRTNQDLAVLSMLAIGRIIRAPLPGSVEVVLERSDQGPFLVPADRYLSGDGASLTGTDELGEAIRPYCENLNDDNEGTWLPFVRDVTSGGRYRLKITDLLFACRTCDADRSLALRMAREASHKPRRATVTFKMDVDVYASGDAAQAKRAICDHLRVISADESVLRLTGQTQPDLQVA